MGHIPHVLIPAPWDDAAISIPPDTLRHLSRVLRLASGDPCSYTDGAGTSGVGTITAGAVKRGEERSDPPPPSVTLAVAPPTAKDRLRWLVEKTCELGVTRIRWLQTAHGEGRPPRHDKALAWAQMALEQSRRSHLTDIDDDWSTFPELTGSVVAFDRDGATIHRLDTPTTLLVGPEGGWAPGELPVDAIRVTLGDGVLRTETAAVVGVFAARMAIP